MQVVLIYPKTKPVEFEEAEVPYSILFVGSALSQKGYDVRLFDQRLTSEPEILDYIRSGGVKYVGISTMTGPQLNFAIALSRKLKKSDGDVKIIWGGVHPTLMPDSVLENDYVDYVVRGEGEETLPDLLQALSSGGDVRDVPGVSFKEGAEIAHNPDRPFIDLDSVSLDWSLLDIRDYVNERNGIRAAVFVASRGCPYRCKYCWNTVAHKRRVRAWSFEKIKEELAKLDGNGIEHIYFFDDNMIAHRDNLLALDEYLYSRGITWSAQLRIDFVNRGEVVEKLKGCALLLLGAESGSQRMLDALHKDLKVEDIARSAERLKATGLQANYSWMIGLPGETMDDVQKTIALVDEVAAVLPDALQRLRIYNPYPGTELYAEAVRLGFKAPEKLEDWQYFSREYCVLDYVKNPWHLKCISYVSYFHFYQGKARAPKRLYRLPLRLLRILSKWRWEKKFFGFPLEFWLIEKVSELLSATRSRYKH
jgi:anaerobic magnesium-protoporphyrin IX monomethyl ester cyclase